MFSLGEFILPSLIVLSAVLATVYLNRKLKEKGYKVNNLLNGLAVLAVSTALCLVGTSVAWILTEAIAKNPNWTFAGIYADEGITGTATTKRKDFLRLMRDCEKGKVDFILTKSVSRFARNTVDSLMWTRKLRAKGIGVYFE